MTMFMIEGQMGRLAIEAPTLAQAKRTVRVRYGTINAPYTGKAATVEELAEHLRGGAMFFDGDMMVMDPFDAYPKAGLPVPAKFARAS